MYHSVTCHSDIELRDMVPALKRAFAGANLSI